MAPDIPQVDADRDPNLRAARGTSAMSSCVCFFIRLVSLFSERPSSSQYGTDHPEATVKQYGQSSR